MSPSTSVSKATQEQQTIEEAFIAVYVAARTNGTFPTSADGLQCIVDAERKVAGTEATAAGVAASKGTKRVYWIEEAQSHDKPRALKIRSRKSTGDTTEDLSPESMDAPRKPRKREAGGLRNDAKDRTPGLGVTARESTHEGAQEVMAGHAASGTVIEPSKPFTATGERIPEEMQRTAIAGSADLRGKGLQTERGADRCLG